MLAILTLSNYCNANFLTSQTEYLLETVWALKQQYHMAVSEKT